MACQPPGEQGPPPGQPARQCAFRPAQLPGRFLPRFLLQVAQDDSRPVTGGQALQFLVEQRTQVLPGVVGPIGSGHGANRCLLHMAAAGGGPGLERGVVSHAVQPVADGPPGQKPRGLADQDQESGLEGVLGVVAVFQDALTDSKDHPSMAAHQCREGTLVVAGQESIQQLSVRAGVVRQQSRTARMVQDAMRGTRWHLDSLRCPEGVCRTLP